MQLIGSCAAQLGDFCEVIKDAGIKVEVN